MKKLVWAILCIFTFSTYAAVAEEVQAVAPVSQEAPVATESVDVVAEETAAAGLTTTEMVLVGAAVVGAAAVASNSSSTSHHP